MLLRLSRADSAQVSGLVGSNIDARGRPIKLSPSILRRGFKPYKDYRNAEAGGVFVTCDRNLLPVAMMLPLDGHSTQAERFIAQAAAPAPLRKRLWKQIVRAKIAAQGRLLQRLHGDDAGLAALAAMVRSGDTANVEARASRRYWKRLFDDPTFRRRRETDDQNRMLNYGYAVLRAIVARAICAAGLHPTLGLHHHNRYNAFCLADDLIEPLRPLVDRAVVEAMSECDGRTELDKKAKHLLLSALTGRVMVGGEQRTLFDATARVAASLADVYLGQAKQLDLPESLELPEF